MVTRFHHQISKFQEIVVLLVLDHHLKALALLLRLLQVLVLLRQPWALVLQDHPLVLELRKAPVRLDHLLACLQPFGHNCKEKVGLFQRMVSQSHPLTYSVTTLNYVIEGWTELLRYSS
jgi:hypothetical protein